MKKKLLAVVLCLGMAFSLLAGCGSSDSASADDESTSEGEAVESASDLVVGFVLVGDENEGYTYAHMEGMEQALANLGLSKDNVIYKYSVPEDETCKDAIVDCIQQGASIVFTNSYGHQSFAEEAASEYPDVQIVSMTGDGAAASGYENFHNAFTNIYEARYIGGVVAGMKLQELEEDGLIEDKNINDDGTVKIGYVGAYPYAEVVSGYTAFFLGVKSVYPNVAMEVQYTNSWFNITAENEAALALIADGCIIIGQHADSTGAPSACEEKLNAGTTVYSVGYNVDMLSVAPTASLCSPQNNWVKFYQYALECMLNGETLVTDWAKGYADDAVMISTLGDSCAEGTQEAVDEAIAAIKDGTLHVFDTSTFTVDGETLDSYMANVVPDANYEADTEAISDGYFHESEYRSAPYFEIRIDGITELN